MATEIERKFLVKGDFSGYVKSAGRIVQGYLCSAPERIVRVRIRGEKAYLTIKGSVDESGTSKSEFEYGIPLDDAEELLKLCEPGIIEKIRHIVPYEGHIWEIDVFYGCNEGLVIAEIELNDKDEPFVRPDWLGEEVSGQKRYYNAMLIRHPYKNWGL